MVCIPYWQKADGEHAIFGVSTNERHGDTRPVMYRNPTQFVRTLKCTFSGSMSKNCRAVGVEHREQLFYSLIEASFKPLLNPQARVGFPVLPLPYGLKGAITCVLKK